MLCAEHEIRAVECSDACPHKIEYYYFDDVVNLIEICTVVLHFGLINRNLYRSVMLFILCSG